MKQKDLTALWTPAQLCLSVGCSRVSLNRWIKSGTIHITRVGNRVYIDPAQFGPGKEFTIGTRFTVELSA